MEPTIKHQVSHPENEKDETVPFNNLKPDAILQLLNEHKKLKKTVAGLSTKGEANEVKINNLTESLKTCEGKIDYLYEVTHNRGYGTGQGETHAGRFWSRKRGIHYDSVTPAHNITLIIPKADAAALRALSRKPSECHSNDEYQSVFEMFKKKFGLQDVRNQGFESEVIFVLRTCSTRVEEEATAAVEAFSQDQRSRVVLVLFYRTHQSISQVDGGKASFYNHPGIRNTFHILYQENDERTNCCVLI